MMRITNEMQKNTPAPIVHRLIAWIIDNVILNFLNMIIIENNNSSPLTTLFFLLLLLFSYYFILEVIFDRTLGKLIVGIMVIDASREKYEEKRMLKNIFIRTLCRLIPLDLISFFFNRDRQLWHDVLSNTSVIYKKTRSENYFTKAG